MLLLSICPPDDERAMNKHNKNFWRWVVSITTALGASASMAQPAEVTYLNQAWSKQDRADYYWTSQGSALLSYETYLALEAADTKNLFNSAANLEPMGFLMEPPDSIRNPDHLPVGVAKATVTVGQYKGTYAGLTCAACHTSQIQYQGKQVRIEGGSANHLDMHTWIRALLASLEATVNEPEKFKAFSERVNAKAQVTQADLRKQLMTDTIAVREMVELEFVAPFAQGPGTMDALGFIHNAFTGLRTGTLENIRLAAAPVKPPFLWNAPQSAWVQWSGVADDPLGRNYGETLGVFARYDLKSSSPETGLFESTSDLKGLVAIETLLRRLAPPKWPEEVFGKLDQSRVEIGAQLFAKHCVECHTTYPYRWSAPRKEGKRAIENAMVPQTIVGTDATQLIGVTFDPNPTLLTKQLASYFNGRAAVSNAEFSAVLSAKLLERSLAQTGPYTSAELESMNGYTLPGESAPIRSYKAAPRDGVWATGPFLHNASVPNIYELLSPAAERSKTFYVSREFDPIRLGPDISGKSGGYLFDTSRVGNSNAGHSFESTVGPGVIGPELSQVERFALIEYLKSIPNVAGRVTPFGGPQDPKLAQGDATWFNTRHPYSTTPTTVKK